MNNKEIVLAGLVVGFGFASGWAWEKILEQPYWALMILFYAISFGFFLLIVRNQWLRWLAPLVSLAGFASFKFFYDLNEFFLAGFAVAVLVMLWAIWEASMELESSVKLSIKKVLSAGIKLLFTAIALFASFSYYAEIKDKSDPVATLLPKQVFAVTLKLFERPISEMMPGFRADFTIDDFILNFLKSQIENEKGAEALRRLSDADLKKLVREGREAYSKELGLPLKGGELLSDVLYSFSLARVQEYAGEYSTYLPAFAALSYFLALKAVSIIFYYAALILIYIFLRALLASGVFKKEFVPVEKEVIV